MQRTEYSGDGPNCSVDSRFGSLPPRNNEMSSDVDRLKQLPIFGDFCFVAAAALNLCAKFYSINYPI